MALEQIHSKNGKVYWIESGDSLYKERLTAGQYQKTNWLFAQTLIDNWHRCIDIGSNNACNAVHYAEVFDVVECFEPTPLAQQLWSLTIKDNLIQNCNLYTVGLGETTKTVEMLEYPKNGGHNHIVKSTRPTKKNKYSVQIETLDSYNFSDVGFIKVDVEGYEKFVLDGAQQLIQSQRPTIQLEIVGHQCRTFGYLAEHMIEEIRSWDYTVVSKKRGELYGAFSTVNGELLYNGVKYRGEMDLWFQPNERRRHTQFTSLFEIN